MRGAWCLQHGDVEAERLPGGSCGGDDGVLAEQRRVDRLSLRLGFDLGVFGSGFRVQGLGFRVRGSGFKFQGSRFRVQGPGFRVDGIDENIFRKQ